MVIHVGRTGELIRAAHCCMACSGSVSLELLYHARPTVILYQVPRWAYYLQSWFRKVRYITLVNLLTADDPFADGLSGVYDPEDPRDAHVLMPEYLTWQDKSAQLAAHVVTWLTDDAEHLQTVQRLTELKAQVGQGGTSRREAQYISRLLQADEKSRVERPELRVQGSGFRV